MLVQVIFVLGIAAATAWSLAGGPADYVMAGLLAVAAIALAFWPRWFAFQHRESMFGTPGRIVTRTISLGLSPTHSDAVPADNYNNFEPKNEHWLNAYSGISVIVMWLALIGDTTWQATVAVAAVVLIGWFALNRRVHRE